MEEPKKVFSMDDALSAAMVRNLINSLPEEEKAALARDLIDRAVQSGACDEWVLRDAVQTALRIKLPEHESVQKVIAEFDIGKMVRDSVTRTLREFVERDLADRWKQEIRKAFEHELINRNFKVSISLDAKGS